MAKNQNIENLRKQTKFLLSNKYFNLWMNHFKFNGLEPIQKRYIMKKFYLEGTIACGRVKNTEEVFFAPYLTQYFDLYDEPKVVEFVNIRNVPFISKGPKEVGKDAIIGYCNSSRKGIKYFVDYFVDRLVELELVLNTNVSIQNIPFIVTIEDRTKKEKAKQLIDKLLNHEVAVFMDVEDLNIVQTLSNNAPYVADKLRSLYYDYENQLYTLLGVDNTKFDGSNKQFQLTEEIDANTSEINAYANDIETCINEFVDGINKAFGTQITLENTIELSTTKYEETGENKDEENTRESD